MRCAGEAGATFSSLFLFITSGRLERDRWLLFLKNKNLLLGISCLFKANYLACNSENSEDAVPKHQRKYYRIQVIRNVLSILCIMIHLEISSLFCATLTSYHILKHPLQRDLASNSVDVTFLYFLIPRRGLKTYPQLRFPHSLTWFFFLRSALHLFTLSAAMSIFRFRMKRMLYFSPFHAVCVYTGAV